MLRKFFNPYPRICFIDFREWKGEGKGGEGKWKEVDKERQTDINVRNKH